MIDGSTRTPSTNDGDALSAAARLEILWLFGCYCASVRRSLWREVQRCAH
jgi:hypothetical protein